jgi:hypothetical protein
MFVTPNHITQLVIFHVWYILLIRENFIFCQTKSLLVLDF